MKSKNGNNILSVFKKHSYLNYCLFGTLFSVLVLSLVLTANYQRQVDTLRDGIERSSHDLLGYIEYDEERRFHIPDENEFGYEAFMRNFTGAYGQRGFVYIWDLQKKKIIWPSAEQWQKNLLLTEVLEQHSKLVEKRAFADNGHNPAEAITMIVSLDDKYKQDKSYMTVAQRFYFPGKGDAVEDYVFTAAKPMQAIQDDFYGLIITSTTILFFLNVLFAILWFGYKHLIIRRSGSANKQVAHNDISHI